MNTNPVEPRTTAGLPLTPWVVVAMLYGTVALVWLGWFAGRCAAWIAGTPHHQPFGVEFVQALFAGRWQQAWPGVNPMLAACVYIGLLCVAAAPVCTTWAVWRRRRSDAGDPLPSLAAPDDLAHLTPGPIAARARRLRPSLACAPPRSLTPAQTGLPLGLLHRPGGRRGPMLRASWEDVAVALMGPRTGKTTRLAVPIVLEAPGPTVATSIKPDLWETTATSRAEQGPVWNFDPQAITGQPQSWWWNPLADITGVEQAGRMADHFIQEIGHGKSDEFWISAAQGIISALLLAAAVSGRTLIDVQAWLADTTNPEPAELLLKHGFTQKAKALRGRQAGAPETREGAFETARTAAVCLEDPTIMKWVTPRPQLPCFDPDQFITSSDTLYLHSKKGKGAPSPLVAALADRVMQTAVRHAQRRGGRIDPPLVALLDEAANICRIGDLPDLYSFLGSHGVNVFTVLQSYPQGRRVWGDRGMDALWGAATIKLVGAGTDDPRFAEDISRLVGEHDVATASRTRDATGRLSYSVSTQRRRILEPGQVRSLPLGSALLLASGAKPALITPVPWYEGPDAARLASDTEAAIDQITRWSQPHSGTTVAAPPQLRYDPTRAAG